MTVQRTTAHAIVSTTGKVNEFDEITTLKRKDFSTVKTVALVGVGNVLVIVSLALAEAIGDILGKSISLLIMGVAA